MESKLAIQKGGQVAISVRDDHEQPKAASPQLFWYYMFLCLMSFFFLVPSRIFQSKLQTLKHPGGVFVIVTFVTIFVTILASAILVFTSCYLKGYMRIIHYTVLKTVGSLSGILAPFFFEVVLFVPDNPSKTVSTFIGVIIVGIMVGYCFLWKYAISHQHHTDFNKFSYPWMLIVPVLVSMFVALPLL
uniref:Fucosyltransferase 11 n=1 Tax=Tanacetum cinerariifolium TaxID=118510 RepID=A0A6L2K7W9_TANCI|nr:fucosyltransferase 11 [Tanacetum cinerariifolium]